MTITIYKIHCTRNAFDWERPEYFSLSPWDDPPYPYSGYDDGGHLYQLPSRFVMREMEANFHSGVERVIYDTVLRRVCRLGSRNNLPVIIDANGKIHSLTFPKEVDAFFKL